MPSHWKCLFIGLLFHTIDFMLLLWVRMDVGGGACLVVLILYFVQHLPFRYCYGLLLLFSIAAPFNFVFYVHIKIVHWMKFIDSLFY